MDESVQVSLLFQVAHARVLRQCDVEKTSLRRVSAEAVAHVLPDRRPSDITVKEGDWKSHT